MFKVNANYLKLKESYLFSEIAAKTARFKESHEDAEILKMGIGDVTLPIPSACIRAMQEAAAELGKKETFRGYGPEQGYAFLREAIKGYYAGRGISLEADEIFVSDGAKSDLGNILDILGKENSVLIPDPVYPVYVDTNVMDGRKIIFAEATAENGFLPMPNESVKADIIYIKIIFAEATAENGFLPMPNESVKADIIYICSPNNPTGAAYTRKELKEWVDFALKTGALILFDAAYERFVTEDKIARSIYEIDGAKNCAIEFCSFSKTAGFTGVRCGYTIVPEALKGGEGVSLRKLWLRRQTTKFNGVSYVVQRGAAAAFTEEGQKELERNIAVYRKNAEKIGEALKKAGVSYTGGVNSPYIWLTCPFGMQSWDFFDFLLEKGHIVGTPGEGFGKNGKYCFRLTAFASEETVDKAAGIMLKLFSEKNGTI